MMNEDPEIVGYRAFQNRVTGELMTESTAVYAEDIPYKEVHPTQPLLRYMDLWKFEDLLKTRTLYFARADKFDDPLEGTVSEEGIHGTSRSDLALAEKVTMAEGEYEKLKEFEKVDKGCTFVNCWHINDDESQEMWDAYTTSSDSVLVITRAEQLLASLGVPVFAAGVKYLSRDSPRTDMGNRSLFFFKDEAYAFEQEFRLLIDLAMLEDKSIRRDHEDDFYRRISVDLEKLIWMIQPHPEASEETKAKLDELVAEFLPSAKSVEP